MALDFVVTGVGRSGSSLLQSMLASHPQIMMPPETGFLRRTVFSLKPFRVSTARAAARRYPRLNRVLNQSMLESDEVFRTAYELYLSILSSQKPERGKKLIGDKDPKLIEYLAPVNHQFPTVKVIHILRDPRDVVLSRKEAGWSAGRPLVMELIILCSQLQLGKIEGEKLGRARYFVVRYEELIQQAQPTLERVCEFLGISFEPSMLAFQSEAEKLMSDDEYEWKKETTGPLNSGNSGKWTSSALKPVEAALIDAVCGPLTGIETTTTARNFSVATRISIQFKVALVRLFSFFYVGVRRLHSRLLFLWKL